MSHKEEIEKDVFENDGGNFQFEDEKVITLTDEERKIAEFIGLYLMKKTISEELYEYVKKNIDKNYPNLQMFFETIFGAPDENNPMVRQMAIDFIR